jgi:ATP-dependent DNA ligase
MAKQRTSVYSPGKRTDAWLKIKARQTIECLIIGYTRGTGDREKTFGALHVGQNENGSMKYVGKVGTGFNDAALRDIFAALRELEPVKKPVKEKLDDDSQSVWVDAKLICEVQYASTTKEGLLREPVFLRLRPDLSE